MTIPKSIRTAAMAPLIGAVIGASIVHVYDRRQTRRNWLGSNCIQSFTLMHQIDLSDQRSFPELNRNLQESLDVRIRIIANFARESGEDGHIALNQLEKIAEFRKKHPFQSPDPKISQSVNAILNLGQ